MKNLPPMPGSYFEKFSTKPVFIKPFDPKSRQIAEVCIELLHDLLKGYEVKILHRGSTAFGISGKGDIEIGIYSTEENWKAVIGVLKKYFGELGNIEDDYARFNTEEDGYEIEIILQKGEAAKVDVALTNYFAVRPELLKEYEGVKKKYSYSKREYQIQKDKFLRKIVEIIPE
mgnify:CR=1 FL=1